LTNPTSDITAPLSAPSEAQGAAVGETFAIGLGISGMPEFSSDMLSGGLYALNVRTSSARFPLLSGSLRNAIQLGLNCTIVTASAPEDLLQRLEIPGEFSSAELIADGRLSVFSMQDEFGKKVFRYGADRLTQELEDFEVPEGSYLVFEQADDLLSLHDAGLATQQIKILAKWFKRRRITGLMAFSRSNEQKLETLNSLMDHLTGIARLGGDRDGLEITFLYWRSTPGVLAARNFQIYTDKTGAYAVSRRTVERPASSDTQAGDIAHGHEAVMQAEPVAETVPKFLQTRPKALSSLVDHSDLNSKASQPLPDATSSLNNTDFATEHCYFYFDSDLDGLKDAVPGQWRRLLATQGLLQAAIDQPSAMILLGTQGLSNLVELARTVHRLRKSLGLGVQILIREQQRSATDEQKQLLLNCGANVVVAKDITLDHYPKFLNALRHQKFTRSFEPDLDLILAAFPVEDLVGESIPEGSNASSYAYRDGSTIKSEPIAHRAIAKAKRSSLIS
jgi:Cellulose biosynthesis GIL